MEDEHAVYTEVNGELLEAPVSAAVTVERSRGWGSVPGLEDDDLLGEAELERWVTWQEWGPILALPVKRPRRTIRPTIDENGHVDWGAFGTVDFERIYGPFDKARYKADILREKLEGVLVTLDIVKRRLPPAGYLVLKLVRMGILDSEHVTHDEVRGVLRLRRQVESLREEIADLAACRRRRNEAALQRALARLAPG